MKGILTHRSTISLVLSSGWPLDFRPEDRARALPSSVKGLGHREDGQLGRVDDPQDSRADSLWSCLHGSLTSSGDASYCVVVLTMVFHWLVVEKVSSDSKTTGARLDQRIASY